MSNEEYRAGLNMVTGAIRVLRLVPVAQMREQLGLVEAVAPVLDPTAYLRGGANNLRDQAEVLAAVANLLEVVERVGVRAGVVTA